LTANKAQEELEKEFNADVQEYYNGMLKFMIKDNLRKRCKKVLKVKAILESHEFNGGKIKMKALKVL